MNKVIHVVELDYGNFNIPEENIIYLKQGDRVRFVSGTKKNATLKALLLTDRKIKTKVYEDSGSYIRATGRFLKKDLEKRYRIIYGLLDRYGYWVAYKSFNYLGPISVQMVFCRDYDQTYSYFIYSFGRQEKLLLEPTIIYLNHLNIMTVLPRCIGTLDKWTDFFNHQVSLGYNAFHFPPIQLLGASKSYYSIEDQSVLNPYVFPGNSTYRYEALDKFIKYFNKRYVYFFVDIVLNHTSTSSQWLKSDPDAVYTVENTPHLASTFELDRAIFNWGNRITAGTLEEYPKCTIDSEEDINFLENSLRKYIEALNIWEYFQLSNDVKEEMLKLLPTSPPSTNIFSEDPSKQIYHFINEHIIELGIHRMGVKVSDLEKWRSSGILYEDSDLKAAMDRINKRWKKTVEEWMNNVPFAVCNELRHEYLYQNRQPQKGVRVAKTAFTEIKPNLFALNNGWVMNGDPLENFATSNNFHYLRRNVHIWGDLAKLRFGNKKSDSPKLWKRFKEYVQLMAKYFNGFRLDNCHGTPLPVGYYFARKARKINPNIIIFAELFTNSKKEDAIFIKRLGINALVKEMVHCHRAKDFVDSYYSHSGKNAKCLGSLDNRFFKYGYMRIFTISRMPVYVNYDLSHDNETYVKKGLWYKQLPMTVLLSFLHCCLGTNKGFDQYYQNKILVTDYRPLYQYDVHSVPEQFKVDSLRAIINYSSIEPNADVEVIGSWNGWNPIKMHFIKDHYECELILNPGHYEYKYRVNGCWVTDPRKIAYGEHNNHQLTLGTENRRRVYYKNLEGVRRILSILKEKYYNYDEIYMTQHNNIVHITRYCHDKGKYVYVVGNLSEVAEQCECRLPGYATSAQIWTQKMDKAIIESYCLRYFFDIFIDYQTKNTVLMSTMLPPGFCCVIECKLQQEKLDAIEKLKMLMKYGLNLPPLTETIVNHLMFGCDRYEQVKFGTSTYAIPGDGQLIYGGFGGLYRMMREAMRHNNLSLPIFDNVRKGDWLFEYYIDRMVKVKELEEIAIEIYQFFNLLKLIPRHEIPFFFCKKINSIVAQIRDEVPTGAIKLRKSQFTKNLILSSYQFLCSMPMEIRTTNVTMAAGVPHFCTGWSRSWGRDTFISTELLLLHPQAFRNIILTYASVVRHGLIPNLLDYGKNPRYNCRDATWWFVRAVYEYVEKTSDYQILSYNVNMVFLSDTKSEHEELVKKNTKITKTLEQIIHSLFQSVVDGIYFRYWNAGIQIDSNMKNEGFNISLKADTHTGFIVGGSKSNCLTWMDKMGSSEKAKTKGCPATSRNGAPIELVGLLKFCLDRYQKLFELGKISFNTVKLNDRTYSFSEWSHHIAYNFYKWFWIPQDLSLKRHASIETENIKIKGMYKDVVQCSNASEEYRLRPNGLIVLALTPYLATPANAERYLYLVGQRLLNKNSIGIGTLDRVHTSLYHENYTNDDDSDNYITAHGFSYHNGPEWVWLYGFYVKAIVNFLDTPVNRNSATALLQNHIKYLKNDSWMSLPELTDINGQFNKFSCPAQAWSISSMILALYAIEYIKESSK